MTPASNFTYKRRHEILRIEDITRREFMFGALGAALLIACGDDADEPDPTATPDPNAGFPREIEHYKGITTIDAKPTRIVAATDLFEVDHLLAMGVKPLLYGYSDRYGTGITPWAAAAGAKDLPKYDWHGEMDFERIAAEHPDLIVSDWYWGGEEAYEQLAAVAPTISLLKADTDETGWRLPQRVLGQACGTEEAAEASIVATEAALAEQKERLASYSDRVVTIAYGLYEGTTWFADPSNGPSGRIVNDLGLQVAAIANDDNTALSAEQIGLLDGTDLLISYDTGVDAMAAWESSPLFRALPAVQEGRYVVVTPEMLRAVFSPTTLSVRWAASGLADAIIQAAEGRGKRLV